MFGRAGGVVFIFIVFLTSLIGSLFILLPFIPLAKWKPQIFRWCADRLVGYWLTLPASLVEFAFGSRFHLSGDLIDRRKPSIIIMNHRTRLDWLFLWNALYKMDPWLLTTEKISLKADLKKIPGAGWAMGCGAFVFLERKWELDEKNMEKMIGYYKDCGHNYQLLLFPEGTDRDVRSIERSDQFAIAHGLPKYDYVLHPRTTGFIFLLELMRKENYCANVYDITVAYPENIVQSEVELVKNGEFPKSVHFDIKKFEIEEIPENTEECSQWLISLWKTKEEKLREFYEGNKKFRPSGEGYEWPVATSGIGYTVAFLWWIVSSFIWIYFTYTYTLVQCYIVFGALFYSYAMRYHNGVEFLVIKWWYDANRASRVTVE